MFVTHTRRYVNSQYISKRCTGPTDCDEVAATAVYLAQADMLRLWITPSSSSIICWSKAWSLELIGAIDMSRTARNCPQLFKCSFSRRKKFHTNRLYIQAHQTQSHNSYYHTIPLHTYHCIQSGSIDFIYIASQKKLTPNSCPCLQQILIDFKNSSVTLSGKFAIKWSFNISPHHLKCVATLPCEM